MPTVTTARQLMLDAAEQLFAERGIAAVSLREVGAAAGQRNNSAVQYHFGSREGLVDAVYERRMVPINDERAALLASVPDGDVRRLVEALVVPLAGADTAYLRFLARAVADGALQVLDDRRSFTSALHHVVRRL